MDGNELTRKRVRYFFKDNLTAVYCTVTSQTSWLYLQVWGTFVIRIRVERKLVIQPAFQA